MLATTRDRTALRRVAERDALDLDDLRRVYARIRARAVGTWALLDPSSLADTAGDRDPDDAPDPRIALKLLEQGLLARRHPDAPTGWNLYPAEGKQGAGGPLWEALIAWLGLDTGGLRSFRTAEACAALDCSPLELAEAIVEAPGWNAGEDARMPCWELLPAGADAANRMNGVMLEAKRRAERRIAAVIDYQAGTRCRHVTLARHLGERIEPCGTSCDVCDPTADGSGGAAAKDTPQRSRLSPADLLAVVRGVRSLEFPVGKKRLSLFLGGSRESRIDPDASPLFGALADLRRARIEEAIDRLLAAGLLAIDPDDDYKVIRAIADARSLDLDDLAPLL
ncbi:MAG TPA: RecQ family zinc-binding domain-containing protein, partial [Thermomicrobiales bacterium]|nr:RecQ family zinc-binding domain-containing protein [Thermomicrobiales bacterium]